MISHQTKTDLINAYTKLLEILIDDSKTSSNNNFELIQSIKTQLNYTINTVSY